MKKLINDPRAVVPEMLEGLVGLHPDLALLEGETVVVRRDAGEARSKQVALIAGGGAGHEPAHAGYVGPGLLSAAVSGDVFTSPSTDAVLAAIRAVAGPTGALLIVKNYTGDRLNFGLAAELARAESIPVEVVIVADDVALEASDAHAGRRGIAGTVLVHKIAGAAAAAGLDLAAVKAEAEAAIAGLGTMGVALSPCTVPAAGKPGFALGEDEIELGLGIHGEAGVRRERIAPADALVEELLGRILADRGIGRGAEVALLVNDLGGTPVMELGIVARRALAVLAERGVTVARACCGSFLTALEMQGCSLSLLKLAPGMVERLDAPAHAPAWVPPSRPGPVVRLASPRSAEPGATRTLPPGSAMARTLGNIANALRAAETRLTALDHAVGDGDLGISMTRAAAVIEEGLATFPAEPASTLRLLSALMRRALGGSSGPLYAAFLMRAATALPAGETDPAARDFARALAAGCEAIADAGGARPGDRTMLEALLPAARALEAGLAAGRDPRQAMAEAVAAAKEGVVATARMVPRLGRASYLGERALGHPDPGAEAVAVWLGAINQSLGA